MTLTSPPTPLRDDDDPVVRAAAAVVGGPAGRYAAPSAGQLGPPLLCLGAALAVGGAVLTRAHCRATGWDSPDQLVHACYSDVATRVASSTVADQPPGAAVVTTLLDRVVGGRQPVAVFDAAAVVCAVAAVVAVVALLATLTGPPPRRPRAGAVTAVSALALSPVVVVSGLVSLELLAVAGVALGLLARSRGRPLLTGAALTLAASVDPLAAVVAIALAVVSLAGSDRRLRAEVLPGLVGAALAVGLVVAAWALSVLPGLPGLSVWLPDWGPRAGYGSLWLVPALPGSTGALPGWVVVAGALLGAGATAVAVVLLARARARRDGPDGGTDAGPSLALLAVAGVAVTAPTLPVQSSLLLLPLVVACALPWRVHLPWAAVEVVAATTTWLYLYGQQVPARGADPWTYAVVLLVRLAAVLALAVVAVRRSGRAARVAAAAVPEGAAVPAVLPRR